MFEPRTAHRGGPGKGQPLRYVGACRRVDSGRSKLVRDEKLKSALPNPPKITFGEVIAQCKTNGAVRA